MVDGFVGTCCKWIDCFSALMNYELCKGFAAVRYLSSHELYAGYYSSSVRVTTRRNLISQGKLTVQVRTFVLLKRPSPRLLGKADVKFEETKLIKTAKQLVKG